MNLYRKGEDYSQNDDGSNHHDPKGGSGPPKSIQKQLKEKNQLGLGRKVSTQCRKS